MTKSKVAKLNYYNVVSAVGGLASGSDYNACNPPRTMVSCYSPCKENATARCVSRFC
ncbi:hypothetical protein KAOT1_12672 [Kordia algicida OT-1]|uniref:Uncharacterized protein n=1 Tax=Kordia algicida OT-1 TaxID=391587 RepID=A9DJC0_9FLAO|nr:hypothetical protein KAOT1_12672 [Kordia algicida OT-1]